MFAANERDVTLAMAKFFMKLKIERDTTTLTDDGQ